MSINSDAFPDRWGHTPSRNGALILVAITMCALAAFDLLPQPWSMGVATVGVTFLAVGFVEMARIWCCRRSEIQALSVLSEYLDWENAACFVTNSKGEILIANQLANTRFHASVGTRLDQRLRSIIANPAAVLLSLQSQAQGKGRAHRDIVTRGQTLPVSVTTLGHDRYCWRIALDAEYTWDDVEAPVITLGCEDVVLYANKAAVRLFGQMPTSLGHEISERGRDGIIRIAISGTVKPAVLSTLRQNGTTCDLLVTDIEDVVSVPDVASFADLPVPIMHLSLKGEILEANRLALQLVGEIRPGSTNIESLMQGLGYPIRDWLMRTVEQDTGPRSEFLRLTRQDKEVFVQVTLSRIQREGQTGLIAVLNDATELKTLEAQFVQGQKMQAVGQLAGGVAHDFNNLLTAISGHCDLLLLRHDQNDPNYSDLEQINQNANRAAALVSQLLAFSRKQTLRPETLDLRDTISDLIHLLNRLVGEKVRLTLSHDPVLKPVCADKRQLEQVLMNLVVNARDAMPEGGEIRIETEVLNLDHPFTRDRATVQPGEYVTVKVVDSGVGIPADKLQKVFEPFYTTKRTGEGTGLGLSTVYGIVKQTGGFIFVDSIQGKGTEFTVLLPVSSHVQASEPVMPVAEQEKGARQGEGVVLLVEDEAPVRAFATRALRLKGYTVLEAESAEDALRLLEDTDLSVDVFVTDVVMPGMDGPTWVRQARETRPDVRVVFMSGYTEGAFGESGPGIGNSTFLPKPFSLTQLTEAVFQQLN